jgi:SAM-dependent methyltransferase
MKFSIDVFTCRECAGWVFDPSGQPVTVEVWAGNGMFGTQVTKLARPDVAAAFGSAANSATCGFHVGYLEDLSARTEPIEIHAILNGVREVIYRGQPKDRPRTGYQTFDGSVGESDSAAKLARLGLPRDLRGKSVLDVGCNEGFFCHEALRRGADKVVGVDINPDVIEKARLRTPGAKFIAASWWNMPPETFDYVLFLSALHHEEEPRRLLSFLSRFLAKGGTLIVECGVVPDFKVKRIEELGTMESHYRYPTTRLLMEDYLADFAVRDIGAVAVMDRNEAIEQCVFHCNKIQPAILLIHGPSGSGKTVLSREFAKVGVTVINADVFYSEVYRGSHLSASPATAFVQADFKPTDIEGFLRSASAKGMTAAINSLFLSAVSMNDRLTILEGYQFGLSDYVGDFEAQAARIGFRVHTLAVRD